MGQRRFGRGVRFEGELSKDLRCGGVEIERGCLVMTPWTSVSRSGLFLGVVGVSVGASEDDITCVPRIGMGIEGDWSRCVRR